METAGLSELMVVEDLQRSVRLLLHKASID
jgi:hypothetical protein